MRRRRRELALAAVGLALVTACNGAAPRGSAPSPTATVPATVPATPSPTPSTQETANLTDPGRPYVLGVIGDWGVDDTPVRQVVRRMTRFNGPRRLDAVLTTGDNAYCCGSDSQSRFAWRMLAPFREVRTPIHPALGNHDVVTEGGAAFMRVFGMTRRWYTVEVGPVQVVVLDSTRVSNATQLAFLKNVLSKPRPGAFRIVTFHHPGWSCSAHSAEPNVVAKWLPLFGTKVDLVLAGHNHTYERFTSSAGTPYVTTGGGGARLYSSARAACRGSGRIRYLKTAHHAVRLVATRAELRLEAVAVDGTVFDELTLTPR